MWKLEADDIVVKAALQNRRQLVAMIKSNMLSVNRITGDVYD